ncbi:hypothetical protein HNY73_021667 [Argiope bruennichi]|uniref:Uncharacterized protein n=1 Tax=Argiope bruennichi TaxID=94029 RepID=A0A8T0DZ74_ARGBR|nr:hypothetical protein HNY73_021667 [Argiope bruennichi]
MNVFKFLGFVILVLIFKFCVVSGDSCTHLSAASGTISFDRHESRYSRCWKIIVPANSYVHLTMESFYSSSGGCSYAKVEVSIANRDEKYTFCPEESNWQPVMAFDDITVTFTMSHYNYFTSRFSMRYRGETGVFAVPGVDDSRLEGIRWLKQKWSAASGWQENTHRGVIALSLATEKNATGIDIEGNLMVKQLEVQALASLLRNETDPLSANQLSMFVNALVASCQDPYNFHGLSQAAAVLAFSWGSKHCAQKEKPNSPLIDKDYEEAIARFKKLQLEDGSFGNIYTSAIVTQALISAAEENSKDWNLNGAVSYLMKYLNSSSVDFLATYLILPVLNGNCLADIKSINCTVGLQRGSQGDSALDLKNKLGPKMRVQYSLYIGDEKDIVHTLSLRVPENITVFEIMQLAEAADSKYKFQWKQMGQKVYVYDIAGITNDFEDGLFWLLYIGKDVDSITHHTESPDKVVVNDGAQIIMWYKKANI